MTSTHDETFRELQLSGKQLVFLFMAVTVVSVVIFLCGVLVGRGVRAERGGAGTTEATATPSITEPPLSACSRCTPNSSNSLVTAGEKLTYAERLGGAEPAAEKLTPAPAAIATAGCRNRGAADEESRRPQRQRRETRLRHQLRRRMQNQRRRQPPPGSPSRRARGFSIQVAALRERSEADAIVSRLASKGYSAYVVAPAKGAPSVFRVRVGKFKERREADATAVRLQKEEQFKPWVVR